MDPKEIRPLKAEEIDLRVGMQRDNGCSLLLYKDARVDMKLLDEYFGAMNWKREHTVVNGNLFCTISIWDSDKKEWVSKQDVGTESNTEKEKGQASDAFKRAGFNWGIGRELYTAPFVWITLSADDFTPAKKLKTTFRVKEIEYNTEREIHRLVIIDDKGATRYQYPRSAPKQDTPQPCTDSAHQNTDTRKVLPHARFNDPKFMEWITKNVGVKTDANITYLLDHSFMNLTPENIKTVIANYRNYERSTTNQ